ncbi:MULTISPECIES: VOC family protein [Mycolicibacterium]|uniref:VOC family protein n=1 Tax=Mycolicibacterium TaxID=1866885 RepID=UPI000A7FEAA4|nr:VOC family protein [Mycolicibacterium fortuitum]
MITRLSLFYAVADLDRARCLFEAVLGAEFVRMRHLDLYSYWAATPLDAGVLELWPASDTKSASRVQLEFAVGDLDAAVDRLDAAGFEVRRLVGTVLVTDPNGNTIALTAAHPARAPR